MILAIMQPYFLPYIGYFQLLKAVDKFVVYDDVNFITRGWINRNNILISGKPHLFTIPLTDASQNKLIHEVHVSSDGQWRKKFLKTISQSYQKAPFYSTVFPLIEKITYFEAEKISELAIHALIEIRDYLALTTEIVPTSSVYNNSQLKGPQRILDICKQEGAESYINPSGGKELYSQEQFERENIQLHFIQSQEVIYPQFKHTFVPWLSILDVLMFNDKSDVLDLLDNYELI